MTIELKLNHTYRTRDGSAEHTITVIEPTGVAWSADGHCWVTSTGQKSGNPRLLSGADLVEEVTAQPAGPVRTVTTTRTEIVPGVYNRLSVRPYGGENERKVIVAFVDVADDDYTPGYWAAMNAIELDAAASTLTQLANALRAIAAERNF